MQLHNRISNGIQTLIEMVRHPSKHPLQVRFAQDTLNKIDALIDSGKFPSRSDFVNSAVIAYLERDIMRDEIRKIVEEMMKEDGKSSEKE